MTLYDKGLYTYNEVFRYANTDLKSYLNKSVFSNNEKLRCEYELSFIINRLYYALYQMAKSYLVNKHTASLDHRWISVNKSLLDNRINTIKTVQTSHVEDNIAIFIQLMDELRIRRNKWDYRLSNSKNYQVEYNEIIIIVQDAYNSFQILQTILGDPQC